jgi:hypothetical protein
MKSILKTRKDSSSLSQANSPRPNDFCTSKDCGVEDTVPSLHSLPLFAVRNIGISQLNPLLVCRVKHAGICACASACSTQQECPTFLPGKKLFEGLDKPGFTLDVSYKSQTRCMAWLVMTCRGMYRKRANLQ